MRVARGALFVARCVMFVGDCCVVALLFLCVGCTMLFVVGAIGACLLFVDWCECLVIAD